MVAPLDAHLPDASSVYPWVRPGGNPRTGDLHLRTLWTPPHGPPTLPQGAPRSAHQVDAYPQPKESMETVVTYATATLQELRAELSELVQWRAAIIKEAQATITRTNEFYDEKAVSLHRQIKELEPPEEEEVSTPTPIARKRKRSGGFTLDGLDGWNEEDIAHFRQLAEKRGR